MPDNSDITRLTELLIGRQDQQQQQIDRLISGQERTTELLSQHQQQIARQQQQTDLLLEKIDKTDAVLSQHQQQLDRQQQQTDLLLEKIDKADAAAETFALVQAKLIDQLELIYNEQQRFNQNQEKFNERQDQFNIIFLDEIRGLKKDVKMLIEVVMQRHEERLKRLEDFMDGFMRQAG